MNRSILSALAQNKQKGIGLPATVFLISILALIVVAMSDLTESSNVGFAQDFQSTRAFYAAETGAQLALNRVFVGGQACSNALADIVFGSDASDLGLENCTVVLSCSSVDVLSVNYRSFVSTATCGGGFEQATRSIEVRARSL